LLLLLLFINISGKRGPDQPCCTKLLETLLLLLLLLLHKPLQLLCSDQK
jgi:hypothetical protein